MSMNMGEIQVYQYFPIFIFRYKKDLVLKNQSLDLLYKISEQYSIFLAFEQNERLELRYLP